jgi:type IV secretory pathway VirB10-like protein
MPAKTHRRVFILSLIFLLGAFDLACHKKISAAPPPTAVPVAPTAPAEEEPAPTKKTPARTSRPPAAPPAQPPPTAQPLRLGETLTPDQDRQYNTAMDQSLQRAQANITIVSKRRLSKEQQAVLAQIQSFIEQAQSTRKTNLTAAKSLAERADVLARELARTTR